MSARQRNGADDNYRLIKLLMVGDAGKYQVIYWTACSIVDIIWY